MGDGGTNRRTGLGGALIFALLVLAFVAWIWLLVWAF